MEGGLLIAVLIYAFLLVYVFLPVSPSLPKALQAALYGIGGLVALFNYLLLLSRPTSVRILPLLVVEEWNGMQAASLDWSQLVLALLAVRACLQYRKRSEG
uniref:Uncharacterized protein n=1 Tax=Fervidicoccus fontis TaxID=683846 RepID=A0A7J3ZJA2_9CREN